MFNNKNISSIDQLYTSANTNFDRKRSEVSSSASNTYETYRNAIQKQQQTESKAEFTDKTRLVSDINKTNDFGNTTASDSDRVSSSAIVKSGRNVNVNSLLTDLSSVQANVLKNRNAVSSEASLAASVIEQNLENARNARFGSIIDVTGDGGVLKLLLKPGTSDEFPSFRSDVKVHFIGTLPDQEQFEFNSSLKDGIPFGFKCGEGMVIRGWEKAIKTMRLGERAWFLIDSEYGYGEKGVPPVIPPNSRLEFIIELVELNKKTVTSMLI
uniref:peptidylprolyl isomerase n=1 Tax=Timspurckia oligopyrenoides TaxID=708627 RepID=A0A7S0ZGJ9_9RHOD